MGKVLNSNARGPGLQIPVVQQLFAQDPLP